MSRVCVSTSPLGCPIMWCVYVSLLYISRRDGLLNRPNVGCNYYSDVNGWERTHYWCVPTTWLLRGVGHGVATPSLRSPLPSRSPAGRDAAWRGAPRDADLWPFIFLLPSFLFYLLSYTINDQKTLPSYSRLCSPFASPVFYCSQRPRWQENSAQKW
jgi:hypothetical protein